MMLPLPITPSQFAELVKRSVPNFTDALALVRHYQTLFEQKDMLHDAADIAAVDLLCMVRADHITWPMVQDVALNLQSVLDRIPDDIQREETHQRQRGAGEAD